MGHNWVSVSSENRPKNDQKVITLFRYFGPFNSHFNGLAELVLECPEPFGCSPDLVEVSRV